MSPLKHKLSLETLGLVYPFKYDFKCQYNTISPYHLTAIRAISPRDLNLILPKKRNF